MYQSVFSGETDSVECVHARTHIHVFMCVCVCAYIDGGREKERKRQGERERGLCYGIGSHDCGGLASAKSAGWATGWKPREGLQSESKGSLLAELLLTQGSSVFILSRSSEVAVAHPHYGR